MVQKNQPSKSERTPVSTELDGSVTLTITAGISPNLTLALTASAKQYASCELWTFGTWHADHAFQCSRLDDGRHL